MHPKARWVRVVVWIIVIAFWLGLGLKAINLLAHIVTEL